MRPGSRPPALRSGAARRPSARPPGGRPPARTRAPRPAASTASQAVRSAAPRRSARGARSLSESSWARRSAICARRCSPSRSRRSDCRRSEESSPSSSALRTASGPCAGAARRCSISHSLLRTASAASVWRRSLSRSAASASRRACSSSVQLVPAQLSAAALADCSSCAARSTETISRSRSLRRASTRSVPPSLSWRTSPQAANQTRPPRVTPMPAKSLGKSSKRSTTHASSSRRAASARTSAGPLTRSSRRSAPLTGGAAPAVDGCAADGDARPGEQCGASVGTGAVQQRLGAGDVLDERSVEAAAQGGRERELEAVADAQMLAERSRRVGSVVAHARMPAQKLVRGRELGADASGLATGVLHGPLGLARAARARSRPRHRHARAAARAAATLGVGRSDAAALSLKLALQPGDLRADLTLARGGDLGELRLQGGDALPVTRRPHPRPAGAPRRSAAQLPLGALDTPRERLRAGGDLLASQAEALVRRARLVDALGQRVVALGALGQRALRAPTLLDRLLQARLDLTRVRVAPRRLAPRRKRARRGSCAPSPWPAPSAPAGSGAPGARAALLLRPGA